MQPSEHASVTCLELAQIADDVGLPAGVLNVITGESLCDSGAGVAPGCAAGEQRLGHSHRQA